MTTADEVRLAHYREADLGFSRSATALGKAIRWFERDRGEPPSEANHVFGFTEPSPSPSITEARVKEGVVEEDFFEAYPFENREKIGFAVARAKNLTASDRFAIAAAARSFSGRPYGKTKILLYALNLGKLTFRDKSPVCHWVWAKAYASRGYTFGVPAKIATPDQMFDFVDASIGDTYEWVIRPTWRKK